jgi:hypothetical protein
MTTTESTTSGTIDTEITVTDLQNIGSRTTTWAIGTAVPGPTVFRDQSSATGAESIVFAVALSDGRRVVNVWLAYLSIGIKGTQAEGYQKKSCTFHRLIE